MCEGRWQWTRGGRWSTLLPINNVGRQRWLRKGRWWWSTMLWVARVATSSQWRVDDFMTKEGQPRLHDYGGSTKASWRQMVGEGWPANFARVDQLRKGERERLRERDLWGGDCWRSRGVLKRNKIINYFWRLGRQNWNSQLMEKKISEKREIENMGAKNEKKNKSCGKATRTTILVAKHPIFLRLFWPPIFLVVSP